MCEAFLESKHKKNQNIKNVYHEIQCLVFWHNKLLILIYIVKYSEKTTHKLRESICNTSNSQKADTNHINKTINQSIGKGQKELTEKQAKKIQNHFTEEKNTYGW